MRFSPAAALALAPLFAAPCLPAHDIITTNLTYTRDISRIFARRCVACHGTSDSIPLTSYTEVRPWAVGIKDQVLTRAMPPWGAVKGFGHLSPDQALTQEEILLIAAWVIGGAPQGDPALLPKIVGQSLVSHAAPALQDALTVTTRASLANPILLQGLRPMPEADIASARVTAHLPDGRIEPLVWLYEFRSRWNRTFRFREPLLLPPGTLIESSAPLRFALETAPPAATATSPGR